MRRFVSLYNVYEVVYCIFETVDPASREQVSLLLRKPIQNKDTLHTHHPPVKQSSL